jgi:uncharacterized protein YodC (DUF2158 family)
VTLTRTKGRTCGSCAACCTTAQVTELNKPSGARCSRLTDADKPACGSCSTYADRPAACAVYRCSWLDGYGLDSQRPDQCGIVFELADCPKGTPFVAIGLTAPGFQPHNRSVRETVRWWIDQGLAVTHDRTVHGTPEQRATLSNCIFQFADGVQVRVGGPARG